ncbi:MAG: UbiA family prenyltransferase [Akkermansiaceae bacterium]|nr:UbiA family prenyltransferase [Armatimonadota bacterium]
MPTGAARWWVYQRERFPLVAHGPLVAAFSFSAVSFSSLLRREGEFPAWQNIAVSFVTALLFFLLLRIADEFKDFEDDSRWRPYRAVPRGLVKLRELGVVAVVAGIIQVVLAVALSPGLLPYLFLVWVWLALMTKEFFVGDWLKKHPVLYMVSHMAIMPLIDLYATACDWRVAGVPAPHGLIWFLLVSFMNGIVIEVGRKLRAKESEEEGVETYTALWGATNATLVWYGAIIATAVLALTAAWEIRFFTPVAYLLVTLIGVTAIVAANFIRQPTKQNARYFEPISGIWTLIMYLSLGAIPRFLQ